MVTILGAGGAIGSELVKELIARNESVRLVSRNPKPVSGTTEAVAADLSNFDDTLKAVSGSSIAFLLAGLKYDVAVWRELWPRIMRNAIDAAKRCNTKLVFFDNVYMYGKVNGVMTEETPFRPCSEKGKIRAEIATVLLNEIKAGNLTALIVRAADFYGPRAHNGIPNVLVFEKLAKRGRPMWPVNDSVKHSFTFTPDAARSLVLLAESDNAWIRPGTCPRLPIRRPERSWLNSPRMSSGGDRSAASSAVRCSG
jgi:nucleoside-diphosphate-sugar epimerase